MSVAIYEEQKYVLSERPPSSLFNGESLATYRVQRFGGPSMAHREHCEAQS
jgi:hypothetical protein